MADPRLSDRAFGLSSVSDGRTSNLAESVAARITSQDNVDRQDLAVAPSHTALVQLHVDGQNFYPALLADMQAAHSSIHFE